MFVLRSVAGTDSLVGGWVVSWGLPSGHFVEVAGPDVPIFIDVIDLFVTLFLVLVVNHVLEGLPDPTEVIVLLCSKHLNRLVQRLKVRNNSHEVGER